MEEPMVGLASAPVTPTTSSQEGVVAVKCARGLDNQGRECTIGGTTQNSSGVEAVELVAGVAEASPVGVSAIFSNEERASEGH